jgi:hypothetical protein
MANKVVEIIKAHLEDTREDGVFGTTDLLK